MGCRWFWEWILKMLNLVLAILGLITVGYGVYLLVEWTKISERDENRADQLLKFPHPMLTLFGLSNSVLENLPKAWFIYLIIGVGATLFIISCFGYVGTVTRNRWCLSFYIFVVIFLILTELFVAASILVDNNWEELIQADETGEFHMLYQFLKNNWKVAKWVTLGVVILEGLAFLVAFIVRALNTPAEFDSDDERIFPRSDNRQPLIQSQGDEGPTDPESTLDEQSTRMDTWRQRMREKYGLDISELAYNPSSAVPEDEERRRCNIM